MASSILFTFADNTEVVSSPSKVFEELTSNSELLLMMRKRNENYINMKSFSHSSFQALLDCIKCKTKCRLEEFYSIIDIACFLMLKEVFLESILPEIPLGEGKKYLKALHTLLLNQYFNIVKNIFQSCRLPQFLVTEKFDKSYHKWKKNFTQAARFHQWYVVKCQPNCICVKCTQFRHERGEQFTNCVYSTPYMNSFPNTPMARMRETRQFCPSHIIHGRFG